MHANTALLPSPGQEKQNYTRNTSGRWIKPHSPLRYSQPQLGQPAQITVYPPQAPDFKARERHDREHTIVWLQPTLTLLQPPYTTRGDVHLGLVVNSWQFMPRQHAVGLGQPPMNTIVPQITRNSCSSLVDNSMCALQLRPVPVTQ